MRTFVPGWGTKAPAVVPASNKPNPNAMPADQAKKVTEDYYANLGDPVQRTLDYGMTNTDTGSKKYSGPATPASQEAQRKRMAEGVDASRAEQDWLRGDLEGTLDQFNRGDVEIVELDQAAYDKLSPAEQDAVDFNTLLYNANSADSQLAAPKDTGDYAKDFQQVFSTGKAADSYNPNLVNTLQALGMTDAYGSLDDYTSLRAGILASDFAALNSNRDETANIEQARGLPGAGMDVARAEDNAATTDRQKLIQRLANQTRDLKQRMDSGLEGMDFSLYGDFSDRVSAYLRREANDDTLAKNKQQALLDATLKGTDPDAAEQQYSPEGTYEAVLARMSSSAEAQNWNRTEVQQELQEMGLNFKDFQTFAKSRLNTNALENTYGDGAEPVPVDWLRKQLGL